MRKILFSGCRSGKFPLEYAATHPQESIIVHAYDVYQAHKISEDLAHTQNITVICTPSLPNNESYDEAFYYATSKLVSAELELDTIQDIYLHLAEGAQLISEGVSRETLKKVFKDNKCIKHGPLNRIRSFAAEFVASVPNGPKLKFASFPGCFCHRRADEGGLALAEVAARETPFVLPTMPVLDIGCGSGMVGILLAEALLRGGCVAAPLTMIDSHTRAIEAAKHNAFTLGLKADAILSDDGLSSSYPLYGKFAVAVGNPPYYGDGRIANLFAQTMRMALASHGKAYMVAKNPNIISEAMENEFSTIKVFSRRGYSVLVAENN